MMNDIDDSQPYRHEPIYYCTRNLSILNVSSKSANNRRRRFVDIGGDKIYQYLGAVVVIGCLAWYFVTKGGLF